MKHAASRGLYAYWEERRGGRAAPERAEVEPSAIRQILSETFIVALDDSAGHPFRLAGTRLCALFGRELKGESFLSLWAEPSRRSILGLLTILREELVGTVAGVTAEAADGGPIELELLLLPLAASRPSLARTIGVLAPLRAAPWTAAPIGTLTLGSRRHIGSELERPLLPRFLAQRTRRGLVVYDGGRS